jgi:hypothetical protein
MALHSVATPETLDRHEPDPYERLHAKLEGLRAISALANVAHEQGDVTEQVWQPLWHFIGEMVDDMRQDAEELRRHSLPRGVPAARA